MHLVSPYLQFTDAGKTAISVDSMLEDIVKVMAYLTKTVAKEIRRAQREKRRYDRERSMGYNVERDTKIDLMHKYFLTAFRIASGRYPVKCRQVWYKAREIVGINEGVELKSTDYGTFREDVTLHFQQTIPEVEELLLFEQRGSFIDPFFRRDLPLATKEVREYIRQEHKNLIEDFRDTRYDVDPKYLFNKVLFIEKRGFNDLIFRSKIDRELTMGVMSCQGFGTRAAKALMKYFSDLGMEIYILTDCDIPGQLIYDKIRYGSKTYTTPLPEVKRIGLTYADVVSLGKEDLFETHTRKHPYRRELLESVLTEDEIEFFCVGYGEYRRVELNTFTNNEFLEFIRSKVSDEKVSIPPDDVVLQNITIDLEGVYGETLARLLPDLGLNLDKERLLSEIKNKANGGGKHWVYALNECLQAEKEKQTDGLCKIIQKHLSLDACNQISKIDDFTQKSE